MSGEGTITTKSLDDMANRFESNPINAVLSNIMQTTGVRETSYSKSVKLSHDKGWTHKLALESRATSQRQSGRCWLFAACNLLRQPIMRAYGLSNTFEISQTFLFFHDKLEKANWALQVLIDTVDSDPAQCEDRLWSHVLHTPQQDGGQFTMFLDIVRKYGLVPKSAYSDASGSMRSQPLNWLINNKLREAGFRIKQLYLHHAGPAPVSAEAHAAALVHLRAYAAEVVSQVHHVLSTALGPLPTSFAWRVEDGGHGRSLTPADAARVNAKWGEDLVPAADASVEAPWTPMEWFRMVVEPSLKHGFSEKLTLGKLVVDAKAGDGSFTGPTSPGVDGSSSPATPAVPHGTGIEGDEQAEALMQVSQRTGKSAGPKPGHGGGPCCTRGIGPGPAGTSPVAGYLGGLISLVNDPRHEYWRSYTVAHLGTVWGGVHPVLYVNVPADVLLAAVTYSLCARGRPVWFGCDAGKYTDREAGLWDPAAFPYAATLGTEVGQVSGAGHTGVRGAASGACITGRGGVYGKRERVLHGESLMTHAMMWTGLDARPYAPAAGCTDDHVPQDLSAVLGGDSPSYVHRLRVENSWGEDKADKGYHSISFQYFNEFCYQAVIHVDDMAVDMKAKVEEALQTVPVVMPLWDPMGALAM